VSDEVVLQEV